MSLPEVTRTFIETEDGYAVSNDYGKAGGGMDRVHIPPSDPVAAARNRRALNAVLARFGYKLEEVTGGQEQPDAG